MAQDLRWRPPSPGGAGARVRPARDAHRLVDARPWASLTYIDGAQEQVHVDCRTAWEERPAEKRRPWEWFKSLPPPLGYDPGLFFTDGVDSASFGALRLEPWRVELWSLADLMAGRPPRVWRASPR